MEKELFENIKYELTQNDRELGFIVKGGQKTTVGIEKMVEESLHASKQIEYNQRF